MDTATDFSFMEKRLTSLLDNERAALLEQHADAQLDKAIVMRSPAEELAEYLATFPRSRFVEQIERIKHIDAALCQIELGLYGICSDCEEPIEAEVLRNDPAEQRCKKCQQRFEKRAKAFIAL